MIDVMWLLVHCMWHYLSLISESETSCKHAPICTKHFLVMFVQFLTVLTLFSYGLLGPSGCGKTTLLRCIVGRIKPQQGHVRVFGYQPNEPGSQIPGPSVGYMPQVCVISKTKFDVLFCPNVDTILQEVAVYDEFTIEEMLYYFGRLFSLEPDFLNERILFLISFLDLPNKNRLVKHLRLVFNKTVS